MSQEIEVQSKDNGKREEAEVNPELLLSSYAYDLPDELIAQHPAERRDASRMMVLKHGEAPQHRHVSDILEYLRPDDCLVINNTRVIAARLYGAMKDTGSPVEILLLKRLNKTDWHVIAKPGKKLKAGRRIVFLPERLEAESIGEEAEGVRILHFYFKGIFEEILDEAGTVPLPPYIHEKLADPERYQTVYSKINGSAAAPTAGLHFTQALLQKIRDQGTDIAELTLHVGLGTFRPVHEDDVRDHQMHSEHFEMNQLCADKLNACRERGGRIVAIGTTSCRTLETVVDRKTGRFDARTGETSIFIYPGFKFAGMDALLTNFHLPESTLLMLVSAFYGRERMLAAYREAVRENYRFYSFGDCMLILPEGLEV